MSIRNSKHTPSVYYLVGCKEAEGVVFLCPYSARQWEQQNLPGCEVEHAIGIVQVVYYPSRSPEMKTFEQVLLDRGF